MDERRGGRSPNHPSLRAERAPVGESPTGEISWPLVERRRRVDSPPDGVERRSIREGSRFRGRFGRRRSGDSPRIDSLLRANDLLLELRKISLSLPQEFDLDVVLDRGVERVLGFAPSSIVTILLESPTGTLVVVRGRGASDRREVDPAGLPHSALLAMDDLRSRRSELGGEGLASEARVGVYSALRARGRVIGLLAVEARSVGDLDPTVGELATGVADALAVGIDNSRLVSDMRRRTEEATRRRIARDLHDRTGATLAAIGFELDRVIDHSPPSLEPDLRSIRSEVGALVSELRETLTDLHTEGIPTGRLASEVERFAGRLGHRSGLSISLEFDSGIDLPPDVAGEMLVIAKEALINAERHARASSIDVRTRRDGDAVILEIEDNGRGFDTANVGDASYGLLDMRERADGIGARMTLLSDRGGTTVRISWRPVR